MAKRGFGMENLNSLSTNNQAVILTNLEKILNWARANSLWPLTFGTSCCAIEMMMATGSAHYDLSRFGAEVVRVSPRQADVLIVAGTIVKRMAKPLKMLFNQMMDPKYVIATGSCTISGGPFIYNSYTTIRGVDKLIPVDVYVPGCPPRPEALFWGILVLQKMILQNSLFKNKKKRYRPVLAALPEGICIEEIHSEMKNILKSKKYL
jgi:NADH-quinone oxidoreductase subunit B